MNNMLSDQQLDQIGQYIKNQFGSWIKNYDRQESRFIIERELNITERIVRVEEGLKHIMEQIDQRFDDSNARFECMQTQMNKRFNQMFAYMTTSTVMLGVLMSVYQFLS